eukprot:5641282-Amphidinium_carterae.1
MQECKKWTGTSIPELASDSREWDAWLDRRPLSSQLPIPIFGRDKRPVRTAPLVAVHEALCGGTQTWGGSANSPVLATTPTTCLAEPARPTTIREQQPKPLPEPYASGKWQVWTDADGWQHWSNQSENWDSKKAAAEQRRQNRPRWENWGSWADQAASHSQAA